MRLHVSVLFLDNGDGIGRVEHVPTPVAAMAATGKNLATRAYLDTTTGSGEKSNRGKAVPNELMAMMIDGEWIFRERGSMRVLEQNG